MLASLTLLAMHHRPARSPELLARPSCPTPTPHSKGVVGTAGPWPGRGQGRPEGHTRESPEFTAGPGQGRIQGRGRGATARVSLRKASRAQRGPLHKVAPMSCGSSGRARAGRARGGATARACAGAVCQADQGEASRAQPGSFAHCRSEELRKRARFVRFDRKEANF